MSTKKGKNIIQRKRIWRSILTVLASIVVFVTTYALIIPAITWEKTLICEIPEHTHDASCYSDGTLVCEKIEHVHTEACFDAPKSAGELFICGKTSHTHTDDCYYSDGTLKCTLQEHRHGNACYEKSIRTISSGAASDGAVAEIRGMLPITACAEIEAVPLSDAELTAYFGAEKAALMTDYAAYDIRIMVGNAEWQPDESVSVAIKHPDIRVPEGENLSLAHIDSVTREISKVAPKLTDNGDIEFRAEGFSLYVAYTVDFRYGELTFSIAGKSGILLSELFEKLAIEKSAAEAVRVDFSNDTLLMQEPVLAEDGAAVVDRKLISLESFDTNETMTIEFADGDVLEINVTDPQSGSVWAYHSGSSTHYAEYATVYDAYTDAEFDDGDILEFHGNVAEAVTAQIVFRDNVTILSEDGVSHTWSFPDIQTQYGVRVSAANKTLTIGGGNGSGALIVDNNGVGGFADVAEGTLIINNRTIIMNCKTSGASGGPVLVMKCEGLTTPVLRINGGMFVNNESQNAVNSQDGGFITNLDGVVYLYGGAFEDNKAPEGKGNAVYNSGELHINGSPVFDEDQDIYIVCGNDALHLTYDEHAIIKDGVFGSNSIPVTLGTEISALYEKRNILESGTVNVTSADAAVFDVLNEEDLNSYYKKLGYTAEDDGTGTPVIELVPDFVNNMENFIDDDYTVPALPDPVRTKTAHWLDGEKTGAEIIINEDSNRAEGPILVLGPLCAAHNLNGQTIAATINKLAEYNDVDYYFESLTCAGPSQSPAIRGTVQGPVEGTVAKGGSISGYIFGKSPTDDTLFPGAHNAGGCIALKLQNLLQEKQYSNIVLFFDNYAISTYSSAAYTPEEQVAFYQTANLLKPYYDNNQVLWISAGYHIIDYDYELQKQRTNDSVKVLLGRGSYSDNEAFYHYDETKIINYTDPIGKFDKFVNFFNMALFDPATWLEGVHNNRIPAWEEYDVDNLGVLYSNYPEIVNYINAWVQRDAIIITDTVDPGLPVDYVIIEVIDEDGETWIDITENSGVSVSVNDQVVECTITDASYFYKKLRVRILCDCPGEFKTKQDEPKDTNIGEATICYYYEDSLNEIHPLVSPQLYKALPATTVTKQFAGLTTDQLAALADGFRIVISDAGTEEIVAELTLLAESEDEMMIAPDSVSEDGLQFTWKVVLPNGEYSFSESGADFPGYIRKTEGLSAITVDTSDNGSKLVPVEIENDYQHGYKLPETGGIGIYLIYAFGSLFITVSVTIGFILRRKCVRRTE